MSTTITTRLVDAIAQTWTTIRQQHAEVPDVVITLGSGAKKKGLTLGHFAASAWQSGDNQVSELFIGAEGLKSGATELLGTLLHEAAHGLAHTRGIKDTSRQGRYHNEKYRALATELGLAVTKDDQIGWSDTKLGEGAAEAYASELAALRAALVAHRRTFGQVDDGNRKSNNNGLPAFCRCGRRIRISHTVYDEGPIVCELCNSPFRADDTEATDGAQDEQEDA